MPNTTYHLWFRYPTRTCTAVRETQPNPDINPKRTSSTSSINSPLSSSITPLLFHSRFKTFFFLQIIPTIAFLVFLRTDSTDSPDCLPILPSISVFTFFLFSTFYFFVPCGRWSWLVTFWAYVKIASRIASYSCKQQIHWTKHITNQTWPFVTLLWHHLWGGM